MLQPFFNVLLWAAVLTVVFYPMHLHIRARTRSPSLAAAASTLLVVLLIVLPVTFITIAVVRELSGAAANLQGGVAAADRSEPSGRRLAPRARAPLRGHRPGVGAAVPGGAHADLGRAPRQQHPGRRRRRRRRGRADGAGRLHDVLFVPRRRPAPRCGLRDGAARARPVARHHRPDARRHRRDALRRARDLADPGHARHVHLLVARPAVAAAVGRRDVLPVDDPDGGSVPRVGARGDLSRADRCAS